MDDHPADHRQFTTTSGDTLCETCARLEAGWKECRWCKRRAPTKICAECVAAAGVEVCADCDGEGYYGCAEIDCHGEFCEDGWNDCQECGGAGVVDAATPPRPVETVKVQAAL